LLTSTAYVHCGIVHLAVHEDLGSRRWKKKAIYPPAAIDVTVRSKEGALGE